MPRPTWHLALLSTTVTVAGAAVLIDAALQQALQEFFACDYNVLCPAQRIDALDKVLSAGPVLLQNGLQLNAAPA